MIVALGGIALSSSAGEDAMDRFQELDPSRGSGSGRYVFWRIALDHIASRGIDAQIVGEGMGAVRNVMGHDFGLEIGCHNDWLDVICSFGAVGLLMLVWWYLAFVRFIIGLYRGRHPAFHGALSGFVILAVISLGTGGAFEPALAVTYASLGFWAAQPLWTGQ